MNIAFFTENDFEGEVLRSHKNMRTEMAWMSTLQAYHYNIHHQYSGYQQYDLGIVIIPKKNSAIDLDRIKERCHKVAIMQEGPHTYWQDYDMNHQVHYYNNLMDADFLLCHNEYDRKYYSGLTKKPVYVLPSLMIDDYITESSNTKDAVIIGGNMCSWYGGMDSYVASTGFELPIYAPSMGRKVEGESAVVTHLPYMKWLEWMTELSTYKYAVHLMRTYAAGTFMLNTSYFGIPTICYNTTDTAKVLHPLTSVNEGDMERVNELVMKLKDPKFYKLCSETTKKRYNEYYTEDKWLQYWEKIARNI